MGPKKARKAREKGGEVHLKAKESERGETYPLVRPRRHSCSPSAQGWRSLLLHPAPQLPRSSSLVSTTAPRGRKSVSKRAESSDSGV